MVLVKIINVSDFVKTARIVNLVNFVQMINVFQLVAIKILNVVMEINVFLKHVLLDAKQMKNAQGKRNA